MRRSDLAESARTSGSRDVDELVDRVPTLGALPCPLHAALAADVIIVLDFPLQTVHALSGRRQQLVLAVLDLPLNRVGALGTAIQHLHNNL